MKFRRHGRVRGSNTHGSASSSSVSLRRRSHCAKEFSDANVVEKEKEIFVVHGPTKTPKISNRARPDTLHPQNHHKGHLDLHDTDRNLRASVKPTLGPIHRSNLYQDRTVPSVSVEAFVESNAEEFVTKIEPTRNQSPRALANHRQLNGNQDASHPLLSHPKNRLSSKRKLMEGVTATSYHSTDSAAKRALIIKDPVHCAAKRTSSTSAILNALVHSPRRELQESPKTLDSMDCSSGESLGMEHSGLLLPQHGTPKYQTRTDDSSFTSSKLEKLRTSKLDNPEVVSAMLSSRQRPATSRGFPLGSTIGADHLDDWESVDASELTMRTMEELEIVSEETGIDSLLIPSRTYRSNINAKKYFGPKDTNISIATQAARSKCLDILKGSLRSITGDELLPAETRSPDLAGEISEVKSSEDLLSPPSTQSLQASKYTKQANTSAQTAPMVIRIDRLPESSANNILFEYQGEMFRHAPLPSGWEVRISKSKNRPFYVHPERGATWHCPVVNPVGAAKASPIESIFELSSACGGTDEEDTDSFEIDENDSLQSAQHSIASLEYVDKASMENAGYGKMTQTDEHGDNDVTNTTRSSTTGGNLPWDVVKRAITVEQGDLTVRRSDSTIEKPVCASSIKDLEGEVTADAILQATITTRSGGSPASNASKSYDNDDEYSVDDSYGEVVELNMTSPDEEITNLVLVNLAQRRTRKDGETVVLYQCDRVDGPLQLPNMRAVTQRNHDVSSCATSTQDEAKGNSSEVHEDLSTRADAATVLRNDAGSSLALHCATRNLRADRVDAIEINASRKGDDDGMVAYSRDQLADDDFPPMDDSEVRIEIDRIILHPAGVGDLRQPFSTILSLRGSENDGESELATPSAVGSFVGVDDVADSPVDDNNKMEDYHADDRLQDDVIVGGAQSVFHPKVIDTNSDCTVSTIGGGYQRESCAGGTHLSKMSCRILNPPHPICALQALDQISLLAVASENLSRIQAQRRRPQVNASFVNDPARRLSFLHCR